MKKYCIASVIWNVEVLKEVLVHPKLLLRIEYDGNPVTMNKLVFSRLTRQALITADRGDLDQFANLATSFPHARLFVPPIPPCQ